MRSKLMSVRFAPLNRKIVLDGVALSVFCFSSFGFLALALVNVFDHSGIAYSVYLVYSHTLGSLIPPLGGAFGLNAGLFLTLILASFAIMRRHTPSSNLLPKVVGLGAGVIFFFELCLHLAAPQWRNVYVVAAQVGTPLQWFTNDELLAVSAMVLVVLQSYALLRPHKATFDKSEQPLSG